MVAVKPSEVNALCEKFRDGLALAVSMDSQMNQAALDARLTAVKQYVRNKILRGGAANGPWV